MNVNMSITKTYSLTLTQIGKVAELSQRFGVSQGQVVRVAIDRLFDAVEDGATITNEEAEATK